MTKYILFLTVGMAVFVILSGCTPKPSPLEWTNKYIELANAHDIQALMAMFAPDAQFEMVGQGMLPNLEAIQALHEYDRGIDTRLTLKNCAADGLVLTCEIVEHNEWLVAAGLDDIHYPSAVFTFTLDGKIQKISATLSPEDGQAMGGVLAEFIPWLLAERPDEAAQLFDPQGQFLYSKPNGQLVVALLKEWQPAR